MFFKWGQYLIQLWSPSPLSYLDGFLCHLQLKVLLNQ